MVWEPCFCFSYTRARVNMFTENTFQGHTHHALSRDVAVRGRGAECLVEAVEEGAVVVMTMVSVDACCGTVEVGVPMTRRSPALPPVP